MVLDSDHSRFDGCILSWSLRAADIILYIVRWQAVVALAARHPRLHAAQLWQCRLISAFCCMCLCSESLLTAVLAAMLGWNYPAFPPKLTPEKIQEKLDELRQFVLTHADSMKERRGSIVLEKLRQTVSKDEKSWHNFLSKHSTLFTAAHHQHLAATYDLINTAQMARSKLGDIHKLPDETFCFRLQGKYQASGPRRLTHAEAEQDCFEVSRAVSKANTSEEKRIIAQATLKKSTTTLD